MVYYVTVVFLWEGFILILVADALNLQRVFLALCVLSESCCIQRSIKVVVHGRDVNPVHQRKHYLYTRLTTWTLPLYFLNATDGQSRGQIWPFSPLHFLLVLRQNSLLRLRRNEDKVDGGLFLQNSSAGRLGRAKVQLCLLKGTQLCNVGMMSTKKKQNKSQHNNLSRTVTKHFLFLQNRRLLIFPKSTSYI